MHYHGTPISPRAVLHQLAGHCFCVSFAAPQDVAVCHQIGQSVMLDNGAFTIWRKGGSLDPAAFRAWSDPWCDWPTTWRVIPDAIGAGPAENDALLREWGADPKGAPVWHLDSPIARLVHLTERWPRVCFGSAGPYRVIGTAAWHARMVEAFNVLHRRGRLPWLHGLRMMSASGGIYPLASVDSTDVAQNHHRPQNTAAAMARRWDGQQCPGRWAPRPEQLQMIEHNGTPEARHG